jgi:hypothetical protein
MQKKTSVEPKTGIKRLSIKEDNLKHVNLRDSQKEYLQQRQYLSDRQRGELNHMYGKKKCQMK